MSDTKTIAMNLQHENWEDDGGDHDVFVVTISNEDYETLKALESDGLLSDESDLYERLTSALYSDEPVSFPVTIDDALTIWYCYG